MVFRQHFKKGIFDKRFKENISALNYEFFTKRGPIDAITYNPKTKVIVERGFRDTLLRVLQVNDQQYIYLKRKGKTFLIEDKNEISKDSTN